ncbi:MAG: hypothetical protein WCZ87_10825, partial [Thiohalobacteraceae bacterium]
MFIQFFLRCYRSFSRNVIVSILPLAMPMVFLLLFLDATSDAAAAPSFRVGVAPTVADSPWVDALMGRGVVRIDELSSDQKPGAIDARKHDAILLPGDGDGMPVLLVRKGFESWARLLTSQAPAESTSALSAATGAVPGLEIREVEVSKNDYLSFILPGLFVMVLIQLAMTS